MGKIGNVSKRFCGNKAKIKYLDLKSFWLFLTVLVYELELTK